MIMLWKIVSKGLREAKYLLFIFDIHTLVIFDIHTLLIHISKLIEMKCNDDEVAKCIKTVGEMEHFVAICLI